MLSVTKISKINFIRNIYNVKSEQELKFNKKLQYISDIHLEYTEKIPKIKKTGDYLALLGDIGNPYNKNYQDFLKYSSDNYEKIFLLSGNHEYWNLDDKNIKTMMQIEKQIENITNNFSNIYYLNNKSHNLDKNYIILGTTLWSWIKKNFDSQMGDDNRIFIKNDKPITNHDLNYLFFENLIWLVENIQNNHHKKIIVLSHHLPSFELIDDVYKNEKYNKYHQKFASDLNFIIKKPIYAWLCGHSHSNLNKNINGVYCGINAIGYPTKWKQEKFDKENYINLY